LKPGDAADLVLFDLPGSTPDEQTPQFDARALVVAGRTVYGAI
jgi:predicted amidohydrolase YtcJ